MPLYFVMEMHANIVTLHTNWSYFPHHNHWGTQMWLPLTMYTENDRLFECIATGLYQITYVCIAMYVAIICSYVCVYPSIYGICGTLGEH